MTNDDDLKVQIETLISLNAKFDVYLRHPPATLDEVGAFARDSGVDFGWELRLFLSNAPQDAIVMSKEGRGYGFDGLKLIRDHWFDTPFIPRFGRHAGQTRKSHGSQHAGAMVLASDINGNRIVVMVRDGDLRYMQSGDVSNDPPRLHKRGEVLSWNHETDQYTLQSPSLGEFIRFCVGDLAERARRRAK